MHFSEYNFMQLSFNWVYEIANTLWPRRNSRHLGDDILKCISLSGNRILTQLPLKYIPKGHVENKSTLVQRRLGTEQATSHILTNGNLVY